MQISINTSCYYEDKEIFYEKIMRFLYQKNVDFVTLRQIDVSNEADYTCMTNIKLDKYPHIPLVHFDQYIDMALTTIQPKGNPDLYLDIFLKCYDKTKLPISVLDLNRWKAIDFIEVSKDSIGDLKLTLGYDSRSLLPLFR